MWIPSSPKNTAPFTSSVTVSYSHQGKSTTQFVRPQFVPEVKQQVATYKKFKALTQRWVALSLELCKLEMQEARSEASKPTPTRQS